MRHLLFLVLTLLTLSPLVAQRTTLLDKDGERMRGTPLAIGRNSGIPDTRNAARTQAWFNGLDSLGLNTVRLCWVGPWYDRQPFGPTWSVDEALVRVDEAIENATAAGLNVILNYHNVAEFEDTGGFGRMTEFWTKAAPRYADNDRVFYELNNEQSFIGAQYYLREFQDTMQRVYNLVHEAAPERHIILFSFNSMNLDMLDIIDQYDWIDYDYTTIGFHMYGWFQTPVERGERNLEALIDADIPLICTEWDVRQEFNYVTTFYDQQIMAQPLERLGISWTDWRDWGDATNDQYTDFIIPDAMAQGYWWGDNSDVTESGPSLEASAYPNPASATLNIQLPGQSGRVTVRMFNALGDEVLSRRDAVVAGEIELSTDQLTPGAYTIRIEQADEWGVVRFVRN